MLGVTTIPHSPTSIPILIPHPIICRPFHHLKAPLSTCKLKFETQRIPAEPRRKFLVYAGGNGEKSNGISTESKERDRNESNINNGGEDPKNGNGNGNGRLRFNVKWVADLLLDPDPDNILAIGLTGLLTWASVHVLWQLLFVSLAILLAALKYSFIAALLIFILITLL